MWLEPVNTLIIGASARVWRVSGLGANIYGLLHTHGNNQRCDAVMLPSYFTDVYIYESETEERERDIVSRRVSTLYFYDEPRLLFYT